MELKEFLIDSGFDSEIVDLFLGSVRPIQVGDITGPVVLMEGIVVNRLNPSQAFSLKPRNFLINIPRLLGSLISTSYTAMSKGDAIAVALSVAVTLLGASVSITKNDAAVIVALHDSGAYLSRNRFLSEEELLKKANCYVGMWSIPSFNLEKLRESVGNLLRLRTIAAKEDRYSLAEMVIFTR